MTIIQKRTLERMVLKSVSQDAEIARLRLRIRELEAILRHRHDPRDPEAEPCCPECCDCADG